MFWLPIFPPTIVSSSSGGSIIPQLLLIMEKWSRFCSKIETSSSVLLLTTISSLITWSKPPFLLDAALQHCWALSCKSYLDMSRCWDVAKFCPLVYIVADMLPTCCSRIVGVSSVSGVPNMLATMFAKWRLALRAHYLENGPLPRKRLEIESRLQWNAYRKYYSVRQ